MKKEKFVNDSSAMKYKELEYQVRSKDYKMSLMVYVIMTGVLIGVLSTVLMAMMLVTVGRGIAPHLTWYEVLDGSGVLTVAFILFVAHALFSVFLTNMSASMTRLLQERDW